MEMVTNKEEYHCMYKGLKYVIQSRKYHYNGFRQMLGDHYDGDYYCGYVAIQNKSASTNELSYDWIDVYAGNANGDGITFAGKHIPLSKDSTAYCKPFHVIIGYDTAHHCEDPELVQTLEFQHEQCRKMIDQILGSKGMLDGQSHNAR